MLEMKSTFWKLLFGWCNRATENNFLLTPPVAPLKFQAFFKNFNIFLLKSFLIKKGFIQLAR